MRKQERRARAIELAIAYQANRYKLLIEFAKPQTITETGFGDMLQVASAGWGINVTPTTILQEVVVEDNDE